MEKIVPLFSSILYGLMFQRIFGCSELEIVLFGNLEVEC